MAPSGPSAGNEALKRQLLEHVLGYYPEIGSADADARRYRLFFAEVVRRTAVLVARCRNRRVAIMNCNRLMLRGFSAVECCILV